MTHTTCPTCGGTIQPTRRTTLTQSIAVHQTTCPGTKAR